jgi:formylglycine-generating enzyme required for sulfatase activity
VRAGALLLAVALLATPAGARTNAYARIPGGQYHSVLPNAPGSDDVTVSAYLLARAPVTNRQFLAFLHSHPEWRRDRVAPIFADENYLSHWDTPERMPATIANQPVTQVSWFAAQAYCEARGDRLPSWHEWEFAAIASDNQADASEDPAWRQRVLAAEIGARRRNQRDHEARPRPNYYGVRSLFGGVGEWVEDFGALLVSGDNRVQGDPDLMKFCGTGALAMQQKEHYAVLMRIALLSSMQARSTANSLGFRCARDAWGRQP